MRIGRLISIGFRRHRDYNRGGPSLGIGLWYQPDAPDGEIPFWRSLLVQWDWLPRRMYRMERGAEWWTGEINSCMWTGRDIVLIAVEWRHWYFFWYWARSERNKHGRGHHIV